MSEEKEYEGSEADDTLLLGAIRDAESNAYGSEQDGELSKDRARSIDDYLGKPYGNEVEGRSQVVSRDVYDTIEWIKPSLLRIFTSGDEVAKFEPEGPEDEDACKQETDYINYVLKERNPWFNICYEWFTDGLLTKNAYAHGYWDTTTTVESEEYKGITDEQLMMLVQDEVEVLEDEASPQPMPPEMAAMYLQANQPIPQVHNVKIKRTKERAGVKICVLPPERCTIAESVTGMSVRDADYFGYWELKSISELRKMGFDVDDDIADDMGDVDGDEDQARDVYSEDTYRSFEGANDPSARKVCLRMCWIKYDYDGDGIAELRYVMRVGNEILYNEECSGIPVAAIVPTPMPHRHPGLSVRDMVTDLQEIKTAIWRGSLDNLYLGNNGRYGVSDKVNLSDMLNSRPGGLVRVKDGIPSQEIMPFVHPTTIAPALQMMEYTDSIRQSRTGTSSTFTGVDANVMSKSHSGIAINQLQSAAGQRVEMIARVFAEGVKELCLIVHELCIKHGHKAEVVKLRNKWVNINPSQWKKRTDMKLSVGLGTGNKEQLMNNLMVIYTAQKEMIALGLATPNNMYNTLAELTKAAGFPSEDKFWTEPQQGSQPPQPPNPEAVKAQAQMQIEQMKIQAEQQKVQVQAQADAQKAQMQLQHEQVRSQNDVAIEQAKMQAQMELERWKAQLEAETTLQKVHLELQAKKEIELMKAQSDAAVQMAQLKTELNGTLDKAKTSQDGQQSNVIMQGLQAAIESLNRPKMIVRDGNGRPVGIQPA